MQNYSASVKIDSSGIPTNRDNVKLKIIDSPLSTLRFGFSLFALGFTLLASCGVAKTPVRNTPIAPATEIIGLNSVWKLEKVDKLLTPLHTSSNSLFAVKGDNLICLSAKDGSIRWEMQYYDGIQLQEFGEVTAVYTPEGALDVYGSSGRVNYSVAVPANAVMCVENGRIYLYSKKLLYAYDIGTGILVWKYDFWSQSSGFRNELVTFCTLGGNILVETFNEQRGYNMVIALDFINGNPLWDSLGRLVAVDDKMVYIIKNENKELWVRNAENGGIVYFYTFDNFNGDGFFVDGGDIIYTSEQRYFDEEGTLISGNRAYNKPTTTFANSEVIRVSLPQGKIKWYFSREKGSILRKFDNTIVEAISGEGKMGFRKLKGWSSHNAALLWELSLPDGISDFRVSGKMAFILTNNGVLYAYEF